MSRLVEDLHPELKRRYSVFRERAAVLGIDYILTCTYRSNKEQDALYEQGRTKEGAIVTNARGGESNHNFTMKSYPASLAFDIVPIRLGKPVWGTKGDDLQLWERFGQIGADVGLKWYGAPDAEFKEFPHFELWDAVKIRKGI